MPKDEMPNKDKDRIEGKGYKSKAVILTVSMYPTDMELVDWMVEFLGSNKSDVTRTAIRAMAANLMELEKRLR